ncbi:hypothetical protein D3C80_1096270 [compost metagenome]
MLRVGRVEGEEGLLDLLGQCRVEGAAHGPVVVVVGRRGGEDLDLGGVDLAGVHQLLPDAGVEHAAVHLAGLHPGHGGVVGAGVGDAGEVLLGNDAVLLHEVARHQAAGGGRHRAEGEGLALEVLQGLHRRVGADELAGELLVLLALHQGNRVAGLQARLHEGETAEPGQVQAVGGQGLHHRGVVGHGYELHLHAQLLLQVGAERLELAQQFGGRLVGDGRDLEGVGGLGNDGGQRQSDTGREGQGAFEHGILRFNSGKGRRIIVSGWPLGSFTSLNRWLRCAFRQLPGVSA